MKRDMELVRALLLKVEALDLHHGTNAAFLHPWAPELEVEGYDSDQIAYNLALLIEAGFVKGERTPGDFAISGLTWSGHEFLDAVRDPDIWRKTKDRAKSVASVGVASYGNLPRPNSRRISACRPSQAGQCVLESESDCPIIELVIAGIRNSISI